MSVRAIYSSVQDIGRHFKGTKRHYVWKFSIGGREHIVDFFNSTVSGKKKIRVDGKILYESQKFLSSGFNYPLHIGKTSMAVTQIGERFDLMIDNQPFSQLYAGEDLKGRGSGLDYPKSYNQSKSNTYSDSYNDNYDRGYDRGSNSWNDVKKAASIMKEKNIYSDRDGGRYRDDAFDGYENNFSNKRMSGGRSNGSNGDNFQDFGNLPKPPKMSSRSNTFGDVNKENARPFYLNSQVEQVVLGKGLSTTNQQNLFAFGSEKELTTSQPEQPAPQVHITNDLLEFATKDEVNDGNIVPPSNVLLKNLYNLYPTETKVEEAPKPIDLLETEKIIDLLEPAAPKKDLWANELVNLKSIEGRNTDIPNNGQGYGGSIAAPIMSTNMNMSSMNNMNGMNGMNSMNSMNNMGNMGGMNAMYNNMQGGMGYNTGMGMGMMNQNMGMGMNMNMMNYGQNNNTSYALVPYGGLGNNMRMF